MPQELLADVAVRTKHRTAQPILTYRVPPPLRAVVDVGSLVWVPVRNEQVQGIVVALRTAALDDAGFTLRAVHDLGDSEIRIPSHNIALAHWLAGYYHAPLWDALHLLLPPGVGSESQATWAATVQGQSADLGALPDVARAVLFRLRQHGPTIEDELFDALNAAASTIKKALLTLAERGDVSRAVALSPAAAKPRRETTATLHLPPDWEWRTLDRAPQQEAALRELLRRAAQIDPSTHHTQAHKTEPNGHTVIPNPETYSVEPQPPLKSSPSSVSSAFPVPLPTTNLPLNLLRALAAKGVLTLGEREVLRNPLDGSAIAPDVPPSLTADQRTALAPVVAALERGEHEAFLLHGVTGSGKTEVYLRAIEQALAQGKQCAVLVPEIALTAQVVQRFAARFGPVVGVLHSALSTGQRYDTWRRLRRGELRVVVGSRSAIFAPLPALGLIILDEEHDPSYKQDTSGQPGLVRYHARAVALRLGAHCNAPVILGSATPSLESYEAVQRGEWTLLALPDRVTQGRDGATLVVALPPVTLVDMRVELHQGNHSIFSRALQAALAATLEREEQAVLFLNRRGLASFVLCRDCGYAVGCPHCSSPLTVHLTAKPTAPLPPNTLLRCHSCGHQELPPAQCPRCWSKRIRHFGAGTQRVVEEVEALLPQARVIRWDRDVTTRKGSHELLLAKMLDHEADIIVGTQMIAKGLDLPLVTLVGVVSADVGLHLPDFRAGERAFQLLAQVAGRAGRRDLGGSVIVQSYTPEHYALRAAANHDYHTFFAEERAFRLSVGYPPFAQLARFVHTASSPHSAEHAAQALARELELLASERRIEASIIGPAPAFQEKVRDRFRWHLLLCAADVQPILDALGPLSPGWVVDVDPQSVL